MKKIVLIGCLSGFVGAMYSQESASLPKNESAQLRLEKIELQHFDPQERVVSRGCVTTVHTKLSGSGARAVTYSHDDLLKVWDVEQGKCVQKISVPGPLSFAALNYDGDIVMSVCNNYVYVVDVSDAEIIDRFKHDHRVMKAAFSTSGCFLATISEGVMRLWDVAQGRKIKELDFKAPVGEPVFSSNGREVMARPYSGTTKLVSVSGDRAYELDQQEGYGPLAFSPQGDKVLITSGYGEATIWNVEEGNCLSKFKHEDSCDASCNVSPDKMSASFSADGTKVFFRIWGKIMIWDSEKATTLQFGTSKPCTAFFTECGKRIVTVSQKGIQLWDYENNTCLSTVPYQENLSNYGVTVLQKGALISAFSYGRCGTVLKVTHV